MRKYSKLIGLVILIVCTIAIFYTTLSLNIKQLPQFQIHTISGNEDEVDPVIVHGWFGTNVYNEDRFKLEDGQTMYARNSSFISQTDHFYNEQALIDLQTSYRNFMRGKGYDLNNFYENDEHIAYGSTDYDYSRGGDYKFEIEVLNKDTKEVVTALTAAIPNRNDYWSIQLVHVQLINDELKLVTVNDFTHKSKLQEARLYTFDLNEEKLVSDEQIYELKRNQNNDSHGEMTMLHKENIDSSEVALYVERTDLTLQDKEIESYSEEVSEKRVIIYDLVDKSIEQIDLREDLDTGGTPFYFDDKSLYFGTSLINQLVIKTYNIKEQKIEEQLTVNTNEASIEHHSIIQAKVDNGKLYYTPIYSSESQTEPSIVIIDLKEMETVYQGYLRLQDEKINTNTYLHLERLDTK